MGREISRKSRGDKLGARKSDPSKVAIGAAIRAISCGSIVSLSPDERYSTDVGVVAYNREGSSSCSKGKIHDADRRAAAASIRYIPDTVVPWCYGEMVGLHCAADRYIACNTSRYRCFHLCQIVVALARDQEPT